MTGKNDVQSQAILANLEAAGADKAGIGPRGTISFMDRPFNSILKGKLPPVGDLFGDLVKMPLAQITEMFKGKEVELICGRVALLDAENKAILKTINAELQQGPLAGYIYFSNVTRYPSPPDPAGYLFMHTRLVSYLRVKNRLKAYRGYLTGLTDKHSRLLQEKEQNQND